MQRKKQKQKFFQKRVKGVYTVEASFLFPMLFLLFALILKICIQLYSEMETVAEDLNMLFALQVEQLFRIGH